MSRKLMFLYGSVSEYNLPLALTTACQHDAQHISKLIPLYAFAIHSSIKRFTKNQSVSNITCYSRKDTLV